MTEKELLTLTLLPGELEILAKALGTQNLFLHNQGIHCCDIDEAEKIIEELSKSLELYKRITGLL